MHDLVSNIKTPKEYVEQKLGIDYVELAYMRHLANIYWPGWSWTILDYQILSEGNKFSFVVVHGRLDWVEPEGVRRFGDMIAAHRIQYTKSGVLLEPGNDIKAANTDTMKKALNLYLNISDDVYRFEGPELPKYHQEKVDKLVLKSDNEAILKMHNQQFGINRRNLKTILQRLTLGKGRPTSSVSST